MKPTPARAAKPPQAAKPKPAKVPDFKICPNCQTKNKAKWELCAKCGESLENVAPGYPEGTGPAAVVEAPPDPGGGGLTGLLSGAAMIVALGAAAWFLVHRPEPPAQPSDEIFTMATVAPALPPASPAPVRPKDEADEFYRRGRQALAQKQYDEAASLFRQAIGQAGDRGEYHFALGLALQKSDPRAAADAFAAAVGLIPDPGYYAQYGAALEASGRSQEAIAAFESALARDGSNATVLRHMVDIHERANRVDDAIAYQQRLHDANMNDPLVAQDLARLLEKGNRRQEAIAVYTVLVRQLPKAAITRGLLAEALLKEGRKDEAVQVFRDGLQGDESNALLHRGLASALERSGNVAEAIAEYRRYAQLAPNAPDAAQLAERANQLERQQGRAAATPPADAASNQRPVRLDP